MSADARYTFVRHHMLPGRGMGRFGRDLAVDIDRDCAICYEAIAPDDRVAQVCRSPLHVYHYLCTLSWLSQWDHIDNAYRNDCPGCRQTLFEHPPGAFFHEPAPAARLAELREHAQLAYELVRHLHREVVAAWTESARRRYHGDMAVQAARALERILPAQCIKDGNAPLATALMALGQPDYLEDVMAEVYLTEDEEEVEKLVDYLHSLTGLLDVGPEVLAHLRED